MKRLILLLIMAPVIALVGCREPATPSSLLKITDGMTIEQVEAVLGQPTRIDHAEITGLTGLVYHYVSSRGDGRVVFINGAVFETQFDAPGSHA